MYVTYYLYVSYEDDFLKNISHKGVEVVG
jgi:hypothetical protein